MSAAHIVFGEKWESQIFTSNGTFNVPDDVSLLLVEMYGAGGGGARDTTAPFSTCGGEGGTYVSKPIATTGGASFSVAVGIGGTGAIGVDSNGTDGTDTQFGPYYAAGGRGGIINTSPNYKSSPHAASGGGGYGGPGYEAGGSPANDTGGAAGNGGIGAGGGGATQTSTGGNGGNGIVIVYWKKD